MEVTTQGKSQLIQPALLWARQDNSTLFIDILNVADVNESFERHRLQEYPYKFQQEQYTAEKCNTISTNLRKKGNILLDPKINQRVEKSYRAALEFYNESLRFAETNTENVGWVYLNRALCFLYMEKYNECLKDIELARRNNCPKRYEEELNMRERKARQEMRKVRNQPIFNEELGGEPHPIFPGMINLMEVKVNEKYGRHLVATRDIDLGERIVVEETFVTTFRRFDRTWCSTCLKALKNFIPCPNCIDAMFCDEICMDANKIHEITCGANFNRYLSKWLRLLLHTLIKAILTFDTVEELMEFVEDELTKPNTDLPTSLPNEKETYSLFLKLRFSSNILVNISELHYVYRTILDIPALKVRFNSRAKKNFLMHLIWQHHKISSNAYFSHSPDNTGFVHGLGIIHTLIHHSCMPNVHQQFYENKIVCTTINRIKKGQPIFRTYSDRTWRMDTKQRQDTLYHFFRFNCHCKRCTTKPRPSDSEKMRKSKIVNNKSITVPGFKFTPSELKRVSSKKHSFEFIKLHGHLSCTKELVTTLHHLTLCLNKDNPEYCEIPTNYRKIKKV